MDIIFLGLVALYLVTPVMAVVALVQLSKVKKRATNAEASLERLSYEFLKLQRRLDALHGDPSRPEEATRPPPTAEQTEEKRKEEAPPPREQTVSPAPEETPLPEPAEPPEPAATPEPIAASVIPESPIEGAQKRPAESWAGPPSKSLEETLASRWLVWLGAVALALGGTFFVKYSIDQGWMQPAVRASLGLIFGVVLAVGGEWLRRRPLQKAIAAVRPDYVPPALTAAGVFTAFASLFAAYGLHGLIGPLPAFIALAAVALLAIGLSLLQGWFVALLGLIGAFLTPALVPSDSPSAWALFSYLFFVLVACLAVFRYRQWEWLALATLAGAFLWPLAWFSAWQDGDALPVGLYLTIAAAAYLLFHYDPNAEEDWRSGSWWQEMKATGLSQRIGWPGAVAAAFLLSVMVRVDDYGPTSLIFIALLSALFLSAGRRAQQFDGLFVVAAVMVLGLAMTWPLPAEVTQAPPLIEFDGETEGVPPGEGMVPSELRGFAIGQFAFGALFALGGFVALWGARRPYIWAGVSAVMPVLLLVNAYWRIEGFHLSLDWAFLALALAVPGLVAAWRVERRRQEPGLTTSLGFYAAAVVAFISLALAMTLQQAWLTVALSLQLPLLAWIARLVPSRALHGVAAVLAGVVLVRLILNYNVLDYAQGPAAPFSWVLYGYGVPAAMFYLAARLFQAQNVTLLVTLLKAGALAFSVLLVFFQIRVITTGAMDTPSYSLLEQSLQTVAWLTIGTVLALSNRAHPHPVSFQGSRILIGAGMAQAMLLQLVVSSPLLIPIEVGDYPVVNLLFLAYVVPAAFAFRIAVILDPQRETLPTQLLTGCGFVLLFTYISLEVKRAFQGSLMTLAHQSDAEFQAYSLAWIAFAFALLALGIYRRQSMLRYASLVVLLVAVAKVFLLDMADLTGLYRVASFVGLGLSLVGIGFLYQRYVFKRPDAPPEEPPPADAQEEAVKG